jgi:hypothetical protein
MGGFLIEKQDEGIKKIQEQRKPWQTLKKTQTEGCFGQIKQGHGEPGDRA